MRRQVDPTRARNAERYSRRLAPGGDEAGGGNYYRRRPTLRRECALERRRGIRTSICIAVTKKQHGSDGLTRKLATRPTSPERVKKPLLQVRKLFHPLPCTLRQHLERRYIVRRYLTYSGRRFLAKLI